MNETMISNTPMLAAVLAAAVTMTGCTTSTGGRQSPLAGPVVIPRMQPQPKPEPEPEPSPKPKSMLALSPYRSPIDLPVRIDRHSSRDQVLVASYMAQTSPADAVRHYLRLIDEHGETYEACFARHAFQEALRCAWRAGDPALLGTVLKQYEENLDEVAREPEPRFVKELRKFLVASEERLRVAYGSMDPGMVQLSYGVLQRDRATQLRRHQDATIALVTMFRDTPEKAWRSEQTDALVVAEVRLVDGYVRPDSKVLFLGEAEQRAMESDEASDAGMVRNLAKVFLERSGLVSAPDTCDYLLGMDYHER
jgi:hypothetical protein